MFLMSLSLSSYCVNRDLAGQNDGTGQNDGQTRSGLCNVMLCYFQLLVTGTHIAARWDVWQDFYFAPRLTA